MARESSISFGKAVFKPGVEPSRCPGEAAMVVKAAKRRLAAKRIIQCGSEATLMSKQEAGVKADGFGSEARAGI